MDRLSIERRSQEYADALKSASHDLTAGPDRYDYEPHYGTALVLLARWQGGESEERLRAAVAVELAGCRANPRQAGRPKEWVPHSAPSVVQPGPSDWHSLRHVPTVDWQ